jgi:hypothetical protein
MSPDQHELDQLVNLLSMLVQGATTAHEQNELLIPSEVAQIALQGLRHLHDFLGYVQTSSDLQDLLSRTK